MRIVKLSDQKVLKAATAMRIRRSREVEKIVVILKGVTVHINLTGLQWVRKRQ
jgi:hypothetical protein